MDIKLNFIDVGKGTPLILLHGNGECLEYFINQIEYFKDQYRVIALDNRGNGKSERGTKAYTIEQFVLDLNDFMDEMAIPSALILGFSDGGNIALKFALSHPNKVSKLILNGANLNPRGVKKSVQIPIILGYYLTKFFKIFSKGALKNHENLRLMVKEPNIKLEELHKLDIETLIIVGNKDMIKDKHTNLIHNTIPNSTLVALKGNHFIANKKPEEFNHAVEYFLNS